MTSMLFLVSCSFPLTLYSFVFFCHRIGCIILSVGQDEFHDEMLHTMNFVVNQSDFTVQIDPNQRLRGSRTRPNRGLESGGISLLLA